MDIDIVLIEFGEPVDFVAIGGDAFDRDFRHLFSQSGDGFLFVDPTEAPTLKAAAREAGNGDLAALIAQFDPPYCTMIAWPGPWPFEGAMWDRANEVATEAASQWAINQAAKP